MSNFLEHLLSAEVPASARLPEYTEQRKYLVEAQEGLKAC
jgi:hypothetical protein